MKKRTFNNLSVNSDSSNGKDPESNKCFRKDGTDLCTSTSSTPAFVEQRINLSTKQLECSICMGILRNPLVTDCMHRFCKKCIQQHLRQYDRKVHLCPLCNKEIKTARSLKPDTMMERLIHTILPHLPDDNVDDDVYDRNSSNEADIGDSSFADIWMTAATNHRRNVAKMKEKQRDSFINTSKNAHIRSTTELESMLISEYSSSSILATKANSLISVSGASSSKAREPHTTEQLASAPTFSPSTKVSQAQQSQEPSGSDDIHRQSKVSAKADAEQVADWKTSEEYSTMIQQIDQSCDDFRLSDMLGIKPFLVDAKIKNRIETVVGPVNSYEELMALKGRQMKQRLEKIMSGSRVPPRVPQVYLMCIPPIEVKFRRSLRASSSLPCVVEDFVMFPADTTIMQVKEALSILIEHTATASSPSRHAKEAGSGSSKKGNSNTDSESNVGSSLRKQTLDHTSRNNRAITPHAHEISLQAAVPMPPPPGSNLLFSGYAMHSINNDSLTILKVSQWFEDRCASFKFEAKEPIFDLVLFYREIKHRELSPNEPGPEV